MRKYLFLFLIFVFVVAFLGMVATIRFYKIPDFLAKYWRFHAITLPPIGIFLANSAINQETINHEIVHWNQWKKYGTFGFYFRYLSGWIKYGYRNNPMEIEAYGDT